MEKTNTHYRSGVKRLLAFLLCAVCVFGMIPTQAFAFSPGQKASSWLGDQYVGSDGQHYYSPAPYTYLVYNSDGTMDVRTSSGGSAYRHYMLTASDGSSQQVYCVESGIAYNASDNTYTSESGTNSNYLNLLPAEARRGITLTAIYGWKPGASLPVSGINEDDYKMATQIILWEYQQQLRSDPYSRHGNGHASADQYYSVVSGRPAEKAYNWILSQVASHSTVPSFTSTKKSEAPELELKWDTEKKVYTLTVTDTNNLKINLETLKGSGVSVTRNGNKYTFTSKSMIMNPVTFEFRKDIPVANDMLIWGRLGYQTMMTGASDPVSFFVKIKTETYGTAKIVKTSEARTKIRAWFKKERREENIITGKEELEREFKRNLINVPENELEDFVLNLAKRQHINTLEDFYAAIGYGGVLLSRLMPRVKEEFQKTYRSAAEEEKKAALLPQQTAAAGKKPGKPTSGVIVEGLDSCLVKFAKCCNPLPGDPIVGFITRGYGVAIHKQDCGNVLNSPAENEGRWVRAEWASNVTSEKFKSTIDITSQPRDTLLADVTILLSNMHIPMHALVAKESKDHSVILIQVTVEVNGVDQLSYLLNSLRAIKGVEDVRRTIQ